MVLVDVQPDKAPEYNHVHYHVGSTYHSKIEYSTGHYRGPIPRLYTQERAAQAKPGLTEKNHE
jgi:hypothetical protein